MVQKHTHILLFITLIFLLSYCTAQDTIYANQEMKDGSSLVSKTGIFELGFFSPGKSKNRYLGIWYKKISNRTVVWVANRDTPITDNSGSVKLSRDGSLELLNGGNRVVWSSNSTLSTGSTSLVVVVQLLDTGNLVVWKENENSNDRHLIWQSFDYPGDTLLPGMKYGKDLVTGLHRILRSWKSRDDPSIGVYSDIVDTNGFPQTLRRQGEVLLARLGPWNGLGFSGFPIEKENKMYSTWLVINEKEIYHKYEHKSSVLQRLVLSWDGKTRFFIWNERIQDWILYSDFPVDTCDRFSLCGPYGICSINKHPPCTCMQGFEPRNQKEWDASDWVSGCIRIKPLKCESGNVIEDGFWKLKGVKVPDTRRALYNLSMTLEECKTTCKSKCSCTAYASIDIRNGGSGCFLWFDELIDTREYEGNQDIYIRMYVSELKGNKHVLDEENTNMQMMFCEDLQFFSLSEVTRATCNFNTSNKIGEGGFGMVYKQQGLDEFKNEVICIAKLQHRNLVKLIGYCIHKRELIGYISPEYAVHGRFSIKSDVFSFGVLVLEIISGKRNREFTHGDHKDNLLGHAWRLYKEGRSIELVNEALHASLVVPEVLRSIHVALLCVQHHSEDRPTMLSVVLMLVSDGVLPQPKQPAFFTGETHSEEPLSSVNEYTPLHQASIGRWGGGPTIIRAIRSGVLSLAGRGFSHLSRWVFSSWGRATGASGVAHNGVVAFRWSNQRVSGVAVKKKDQGSIELSLMIA
ncbi:hypothetical protein QVD17_28843 [Tagetes erecta]|uniref:Receptor-like serine/threonine-protein kinase n=1 Tax=Tagetes erecta TaxID=13708 RepID=A0AAD8KBH9_TARER|nr:hypothetical protein QVD17_28843 [Tagetes erecta]